MATVTKAKSASKKKADIEATLPEEGELDTEVESTAEKPAKAKKVAAPRKSRAKANNPPRAKLYWGVFNQNLKRVAVFEFGNKKDAEKHAKDLSKNGSEHFLQRIKEVIQ